MSTPVPIPTAAEKKFQSYVPAGMAMSEFTPRAVLLGLALTLVLGAANAYLGLRAGMTVAATYPAAIVSMVVLRVLKGSILEENIARTIGSIGEVMAAAAVFTLPAFVIANVWPEFDLRHGYLISVAVMAVGGTLGIMFVALLRRVMMEDPELRFPESVAAAEIHKAGRQGSRAAKILFANMGIGAVVYFLGSIKLFQASNQFAVRVGQLGRSMVKLSKATGTPTLATGGVTTFSALAISPAYLGVGYIIGPRLGALNFAGGIFAWGLLVPLLIFFLGPQLGAAMPPGTGIEGWMAAAGAVWFSIVRPIAVGGMLVGTGFTLFRMRKNLLIGMRRAVNDLKRSATHVASDARTDRDLSSKAVFGGIAALFVCVVALYLHFTGALGTAMLAGVVLLVLGFFFAAVSGNLVGIIGSSNSPLSGLTLCMLFVIALLMVAMGVGGSRGLAAVLGVATVFCVSCAVAGEMFQDLKVGHILGGTPAKMQMGDLLGVLLASVTLFFPLMVLHRAYGFGSAQLPAPQAGLMASLAQGVVTGNMAWPLVVVGIFMGLGLILVEVRSPMLFSVGMYLPLETSFAIFAGGVFHWITGKLSDRANLNDAQKARVENAGVLTASGLIAGEALCGLVVALCVYLEKTRGMKILPIVFAHPPGIIAVVVLLFLAALMIRLPLASAGHPDEAPPPAAIT